MSVDLYRDKYIKYKGKYLNLKNIEGGGEIGEAWYFLLQDHIDELARIYNAQTILNLGTNAPSSDRIEKLLKQTKKNAYMIKLGDKLLKNVVNPGVDQKIIPDGYRLGHIQNDEEKSQTDEILKANKGIFGKIGQSIKNTTATLVDKMIPYASLRERNDTILVSDAKITSHINALKAELPSYQVVHIDFSTSTNKYLQDEIQLKNITGKDTVNPVVKRASELTCTFNKIEKTL